MNLTRPIVMSQGTSRLGLHIGQFSEDISSAYERERQATIAMNQQVLQNLAGDFASLCPLRVNAIACRIWPATVNAYEIFALEGLGLERIPLHIKLVSSLHGKGV